MVMDMIKKHSRRATELLTIGILVFAVIVGAGCRIVDVKENFGVNNGFEFFVNMASHFWTNPGSYNFEEALKMKADPDDYVFTRHPKEPGTGSFENEKGWAFILSLILPEGEKGVRNLEMTVMRYQIMLDLLVIIMLFLIGRRIAGLFGGSLAAILYALFKPSIRMASWVSYYYWILPFSVLSIFFWVVVYQPEKRKLPTGILCILFLLYGLLMGFATAIRLSFIFLPLVLSPLIFIREKNFKRGLALLLAMLLGQAVMLAPQAYMTQKYYGKLSVSVRGKWHSIINGLGGHPNPCGVKESADLSAVKWAIDNGGPDLNKVGIQEYDKFMKKEAMRLFKKKPDIFVKNFKDNLYMGITMTPEDRVRYRGGPIFLGIFDSKENNEDPDSLTYDPKIVILAKIFPWLVILCLFMFLFFQWQLFWPLFTVVLQGLYLLGILCIYFPPVDTHVTPYFPIFVLLLAVSLATLCKTTVSIYKNFPKFFRNFEFYFAFLLSVFLLVGLVIISNPGCAIANEKSVDSKKEVSYAIDNTLNAENNGGFELWNDRVPFFPEGWFFSQSKNGRKGSIKKAYGAGEVKLGNYSAMILSDAPGASQIYFRIPSDKLYIMLGRDLTLTGWVKSDNKMLNKVYLSVLAIHGASNAQENVYYGNSNGWENLMINYNVPVDANAVYVVCTAEDGATAYFDGINIQYAGGGIDMNKKITNRSRK